MAKSFIKKARNVKQVEDIWEVSVRAAKAWINSGHGSDPYRPWHVLVVNQQEFIIQHGIFPKYPTDHEMAEVLYKGMVRPLPGSGRKHRPTKVLVNKDALYEKLLPELDRIGIACQKKDILSLTNATYKALSAELDEKAGDDLPSLLSISGVTIPMLQQFYKAAAEYYKIAPWKKLPGEEFAIEIQPEGDAEPRYGIIIGYAGESFGLSVNDKWEDLEHFYDYSTGLTTTTGNYSVISLTYEKAHFLTFEDLDSIEKYGWDIPSKDAYPSVFRANPSGGNQVFPMTKNDIFWLTSALSALTIFFNDKVMPDDFLESFGTQEYKTEIMVDGLSRKEKVSLRLPIYLM